MNDMLCLFAEGKELVLDDVDHFVEDCYKVVGCKRLWRCLNEIYSFQAHGFRLV